MLSKKWKFLVLLLGIAVLAFSVNAGAKSRVDITNMEANFSANKQHGPQYFEYILTDERLDKFGKRVKILSYLENMILNNDAYKKMKSKDETEMDPIIKKYQNLVDTLK